MKRHQRDVRETSERRQHNIRKAITITIKETLESRQKDVGNAPERRRKGAGKTSEIRQTVVKKMSEGRQKDVRDGRKISVRCYNDVSTTSERRQKDVKETLEIG